ALAAEEHVFRLEHAVEIRLGHDSRRHIPVERSGRTVGLLHPVAIRIVRVVVTSGAGDAILLVVAVVLADSVVNHVAGDVVLEVSAGLHAQTVLRVGGTIHALRIALGGTRAGQITLADQVAPGVVGVTVTPVLGLAVHRELAAIGPGILRRDQPVQGVIGEGLIAVVAGIAIVENGGHIAVIAFAKVEVILEIQHVAPTVVGIAGDGPRAFGGPGARVW